MTEIIGFFLGVFSSAAFWYLLVRVRPRFEVAPEAAYDPVTKNLGVKIMNVGGRQIANVEVRLASVTRTSENRLVTGMIANLKWPTILALGTRKFFNAEWGLPATYTIVPLNGEELYGEVVSPPQGGERRLLFTISGRDAFSGTIVVRRVSYAPDAIKPGWYRHGLFFEIDPELTSPGGSLSTNPQG